MRTLTTIGALLLALASRPALADDTLHPGTPALDPPTLVALGVVLPITGDDNFTASVTTRYRETGTTTWHDALPLMHVHAEAVTGFAVTPQFAGTIFDLRPDTSYDIELHAVDGDGAVDMTLMLSARTRAVPGDPATPRAVAVTGVASLTAALAAAQPGDVITLAAGTYAGSFSLNTSGTATNPIVVRGASRDAVILDGMGCTGCNVIEAYGSFIHIENLTIEHANRAIRFQTASAQANVVRRVHITDVTLGIGSNPDQQDFYIADNVLEGRNVWPCVYTSDTVACNGDGSGTVQHGLHANDDGIHVEGDGHVVAHNQISGFGDAMKVEEDGARSDDFYGNDVLWTYDNAVELDGSSRNTRAMRNRFTNTFATLSFQPIFGGPAYAIRNVLVNVADEQFKLHARGTTPTVGAVIYHNTIVRGTRALQCSTAAAPLDFVVANNLFIGPTSLDPDGHVVRWDVPDVSTAQIDHNGYYPDGQFEFGYGSGITYPNFAAVVAGGKYEAHGVLGDASLLGGGLVGTPDWTQQLTPVIPALDTNSLAIDRGVVLANLDDDIRGAAPDLGALEAGCEVPIYGVRPIGIDETNETFGCTGNLGGGDGGIPDNDGGTTGDGGGNSGCCNAAPATDNLAVWLVLGVVVLRRRRR
jgi:hypothetical protein